MYSSPPKILHFLALGHQGADAGLGVEAGNARAAGAHPLGQRALRAEFHLQLTRKILALEFLVLAHIARHHLLDLPGAQQLADALRYRSRRCWKRRSGPSPRYRERIEQTFGKAAQAEAAAGDQEAVFQQPIKGAGGIGVDLVHACLPAITKPCR
jgi:hypothetical protein